MIKRNCTLEIDERLGVIYVHASEGFTALRICGVKANIPTPSIARMIDITLKQQELASWTFNWE